MPALEGGAALPVTTSGSGTTDGRRAAIPVYVVSGGPVVGQRAQRVIVVTSGPVEGGAAIPVYDMGASAIPSSEPAIPVFVVQGSLGAVATPAPVNSVAPVISGVNDIGQTLTTTDGTWSGSPTFTYQWKRAGVNIGSATNSTYVLTPSDSGQAITCTVTATNAGGSTGANSSNSYTPPTYTLFDDFSTNQAAPLTTPRTAEPGPGTLAITDAGNIMSINAGELRVNGSTSGANSGFIQNDAVSRAAGRAFGFYFSAITAAGLGRAGLHTSLASGMAYFVVLGTTTFSITDTGTHTTVVAPPVMLIFVERATGAFLIIGTRLVWVFKANNAALKPVLWFASGQSPNLRLPLVKVEDLTSMDTDAEVYTSFTASPASGATATMEANALIDLDWTVVAAETLTIMFRRTDDDNTLKIVCDEAADTIKFYRRVASVDTEITPIFGSTAQTWTPTTTYRITIITQGTTITSYVNGTLKNDGAAQTAQQNATGMKLTGFATIANWYAWRTDLSALIPAELVPT